MARAGRKKILKVAGAPAGRAERLHQADSQDSLHARLRRLVPEPQAHQALDRGERIRRLDRQQDHPVVRLDERGRSRGGIALRQEQQVGPPVRHLLQEDVEGQLLPAFRRRRGESLETRHGAPLPEGDPARHAAFEEVQDRGDPRGGLGGAGRRDDQHAARAGGKAIEGRRERRHLLPQIPSAARRDARHPQVDGVGLPFQPRQRQHGGDQAAPLRGERHAPLARHHPAAPGET